MLFFFFFQAEDGIRDYKVTGVQTCALPIYDQSEGFDLGLREGLTRAGAASVSSIAHGTTVATNAVLERRGAVTALVTTEGFADLLVIGRQHRPSLYDLWA